MSLAINCDICQSPTVGRNHPTIYANNSERRVDVCNVCAEVLRSQSRGQTEADRFVRAVMGWKR